MIVTFIYSNAGCVCTTKCTFELGKGLSKYDTVNAIHFTNLTEDIFNSSDAIILQRIGANGINIPKWWIDQLRKFSKDNISIPIFYMLDDLVFSEQSKELINISDAAIVFSNVYKSYLPVGMSIYQMRTFIDTKKYVFTNKSVMPTDKFNILYASTGQLGRNILNRIKPALEKRGINIIQVSNTSYADYMRLLKGVSAVINPFEVGDHQLATKDFLDAKSCIKYVEAGMFGKPLISSSSAPYKEAITNLENGLIASSDDQWIDYIIRIKDNHNLRSKIGTSAIADVHNNYSLEVASKRLSNIIREHKQIEQI
jgi:glycosyltransferase involved in cell wall biosynthesis